MKQSLAQAQSDHRTADEPDTPTYTPAAGATAGAEGGDVSAEAATPNKVRTVRTRFLYISEFLRTSALGTASSCVTLILSSRCTHV